MVWIGRYFVCNFEDFDSFQSFADFYVCTPYNADLTSNFRSQSASSLMYLILNVF